MSEICYFCLPYLLSRLSTRRVYVPAIKGTRPPPPTTKSRPRRDSRPQGRYKRSFPEPAAPQACLPSVGGHHTCLGSACVDEVLRWVIEPSGFQSVAHVHQMVCLGAARTNQRAPPLRARVGQLPGRGLARHSRPSCSGTFGSSAGHVRIYDEFASFVLVRV